MEERKPKHRAGDEPTAPRTWRIAVYGHPYWPNSGAVAEAMIRAWMDAGQPETVELITAGNITGAEQMARTVAAQYGWAEVSGGDEVDIAIFFDIAASPSGLFDYAEESASLYIQRAIRYLLVENA